MLPRPSARSNLNTMACPNDSQLMDPERGEASRYRVQDPWDFVLIASPSENHGGKAKPPSHKAKCLVKVFLLDGCYLGRKMLDIFVQEHNTHTSRFQLAAEELDCRLKGGDPGNGRPSLLTALKTQFPAYGAHLLSVSD